jgi:hypothetical protein
LHGLAVGRRRFGSGSAQATTFRKRSGAAAISPVAAFAAILPAVHVQGSAIGNSMISKKHIYGLCLDMAP